ncbi:GNAT family N-acetyltransferase [Pedobacter frigiditerrae]|uniref:GNAT family N-acetyltransferase n=1 Tax=Pedobacter frigiditerrae TaxID=2530452 RepID=A0A4R0N3E0_9SPHI|nr:GNAT family N-acetyltransferase [Pedobacter frigiditerrae]TCC94310.1 GNAT family N-acetyltransferase [Pedobacter frigiditerrae]
MQNHIEIVNSTTENLAILFEFYDMAVAHQKKVSDKHWQDFDVELVKNEISEQRQYKILVDGKVACVFLVTFNDPQIWEEKDKDSAIYLHRIVTHPDFRGYGFVNIITNWAKAYAKDNQIQFVRLDTWADNEKLFTYYTSCGFNHVGSIKIAADSGLPKHYEGIRLNLFEIGV